MADFEFKRLAVTCGGTGGHFYPGLSIARQFQAGGGEVLLLLSGVNSEAQRAAAEKHGVPAVVLPRMPSWKKHPWRFLRGLRQGIRDSRKELRSFQPQALLGMGSFASLPAIWAARQNGVPVFLHDGNARIGLANRLLSRWALALGAGFPPVNGASCRCPVKVCGMPVRPELEAARNITRAEALAALNLHFDAGLELERPTILIFGGSQGAAIFNRILPEALAGLERNDFQVLHLAGRGKAEEPRRIYGDADFPFLLLESDEHMHWFLGAADLVFSRSGGSSVAELALFGRPAVLIPYPYAAENHQSDNADYLAGPGGAVRVDNAEFGVERAAALVRDFLETPERWRQRAATAARLARPGAARAMLELMAEQLESAAGDRR